MLLPYFFWGFNGYLYIIGSLAIIICISLTN